MTKDEALDRLREMIQPGDAVYTILRHRAASGMSRAISLLIMDKERHEPFQIDYFAGLVLGNRHNERHGGLNVRGCGMDMGFHLVYNLGAKLWPNGTPAPHGTRNGEPDSDGGYALKHRWL